MSDPDFWLDRKAADAKIREHGELNDLVGKFSEIEKGVEELEGNFSFASGGQFSRWEDRFFDVRRSFRQLELSRLFDKPYDKRSAVVAIYPGAGGEDADDWGRMLYEMYAAYAAKRQWQIAILDDSPNRRTFEVKGEYVFGYLKGEQGVHRLVRISPFSPKRLRHTSFALVEILPDLPDIDEHKFEIPERDLKFEFFRSSGPGGQNVNKVETAVRVIHTPTNLTAHSQAERSQKANREKAVKVLKAKLFDLMERAQVKELSELKTKVKPEWGSQIRSYVLNPYKMVKDHRTGAETSSVDSVLQGDLDMFIEADVKSNRE